MAYAYDAGLVDRIMPRIKQFEATSGRRITPTMIDALIKGQLEAEVGKAQQSRALDLQERGIANAEEAQKKANKAATIKGVVDTASTAGTGYLAYKAVTKPSEMSELIAYQKSLGAVPGTGVPLASAANPAYTATTTSPSLTAGASGMEYGSGITAGAQTTLGGGASVVGGQAALAGAEAGSLAAYDASLAAGAAEGVGSTAGTGAGMGLSSVALPVAAYAAGDLIAKGIDKYSPIGGAKEKSIAGHVVKGAATGAAIGSVVPVIGTAVGAVVGGIIGGGVGLVEDASVVCSELLRQGRITERDRAKCVVFRFRHIPDDMFDAYLKWAKPHVDAMRKGGWRNAVRLPFAHAFIGYMLAIQDKRRPTVFERAVWNHAWRRCEKIAQRSEQFVGEVA